MPKYAKSKLKADEAKELAYQLYHICDKRSWAKHAGDYNTLVSNWADIKSEIPNVSEGQETLFQNEELRNGTQ